MIQIDPYEISMRHVETFLQIAELTEKSIRHALRTGRAVLAFEIIAPMPTVGFWVEREGSPLGTVGDRSWKSGLSLRFQAAARADIRVVRMARQSTKVMRTSIPLKTSHQHLSDGGIG